MSHGHGGHRDSRHLPHPSSSRGGGGRDYHGSGHRSQPPPQQQNLLPGNSVRTNCFQITQLPRRVYYQYTDIEPEVKDFSRRQEIVRKVHTSVAPEVFRGLPIYDGKRLIYIPEELRLGGSTSQIFPVSLSAAPYSLGGRGCFQVRLTKTVGDPINPGLLINLINARRSPAEIQPGVTLLQLLISQVPNESHPHNARAYFSNTETKSTHGGLELWRGFFHSVRPTIGRMIVNIDTTMTAVYKEGKLLNLAWEHLGIQGGDARRLALNRNSPDFIKLERFLRNLKIVVGTTKRTKVIRGLEPNADGFLFTDRNGRQMSVGEYLQRTYGITVRYRGIVGVRLSGLKADHAEILPLEVCTVKPGQLYRRKLNEAATADAVSFSILKPAQRMSKILGQGPLDTYTSSEYIRQSGMLIDRQPLAVTARLLQVPNVVFKESAASVRNGSWNVVRQILHEPVSLNAWAAVSFVDSIRQNTLERAMRDLMQCCRDLGENVEAPIDLREGNAQNPTSVLDDIFRTARNQGKEKGLIIIVVLPQSAGGLRAQVKHWSDVYRGVRTQCLRQDKFNSANNQYWNNIALKLNARSGGSNFVAQSSAMSEFRGSPTMVMGTDVGHPGPGVARPSISSLVWSTDTLATKYSTTCRLQHPRLEAIDDLKDMAYEAVIDFTRRNGRPPKRIFFYRDGVSEGEFERVAAQEIPAIKAGLEAVWQRAGKSEDVKLTYLIVGKRHHVAFFPESESPMNDGKGNCKAGFVSDEFKHPFAMANFYLQSHSAIIGTSRSSHYTLLLNEIGVPLQGLQDLSFALCHVYAKATRSVSIPAPVYYADLACQRLAFHFGNSSRILSDTASVASDPATLDLEEWKREFGRINTNLEKTMYFL
ncbi:hypothetical protein PM082_020660 [Marasmius tenuissimus]|nr:hypothetical protein PM082_020660 [Marasmius tenuissimus]